MSTQPNKFQPGQRVKVTGGNYHCFQRGTIVEVKHMIRSTGYYKCVDEAFNAWSIHESDLEPLQPLNHE